MSSSKNSKASERVKSLLKSRINKLHDGTSAMEDHALEESKVLLNVLFGSVREKDNDSFGVESVPLFTLPVSLGWISLNCHKNAPDSARVHDRSEWCVAFKGTATPPNPCTFVKIRNLNGGGPSVEVEIEAGRILRDAGIPFALMESYVSPPLAFLVFPFAEETLTSAILEMRSWKEGNKLEAYLTVLADVAQCLATSHSMGILHRHVRPEHVVMDLNKHHLTSWSRSFFFRNGHKTMPLFQQPDNWGFHRSLTDDALVPMLFEDWCKIPCLAVYLFHPESTGCRVVEGENGKMILECQMVGDGDTPSWEAINFQELCEEVLAHFPASKESVIQELFMDLCPSILRLDFEPPLETLLCNHSPLPQPDQLYRRFSKLVTDCQNLSGVAGELDMIGSLSLMTTKTEELLAGEMRRENVLVPPQVPATRKGQQSPTSLRTPVGQHFQDSTSAVHGALFSLKSHPARLAAERNHQTKRTFGPSFVQTSQGFGPGSVFVERGGVSKILKKEQATVAVAEQMFWRAWGPSEASFHKTLHTITHQAFSTSVAPSLRPEKSPLIASHLFCFLCGLGNTLCAAFCPNGDPHLFVCTDCVEGGRTECVVHSGQPLVILDMVTLSKMASFIPQTQEQADELIKAALGKHQQVEDTEAESKVTYVAQWCLDGKEISLGDAQTCEEFSKFEKLVDLELIITQTCSLRQLSIPMKAMQSTAGSILLTKHSLKERDWQLFSKYLHSCVSSKIYSLTTSQLKGFNGLGMRQPAWTLSKMDELVHEFVEEFGVKELSDE